MKKLILFFFLSIGVCLFYWVLKTVGLDEVKNAFSHFTIWQGIVILCLTMATAMIESWKWKEILKAQNVDVPFRSLWRIYFANHSIRYFIPMALVGGEIFCGYLLKKNHSVPWFKGVSSVIISRVLSWTTNLIVVFCGFVFFLVKIGFPSKSMAVILGGGFFVLSGGILFFYFRTFKKRSIVRFFRVLPLVKKIYGLSNVLGRVREAEKEIFSFFNPRKSAMWKGLCFSFLKTAIVILNIWLLVMFLGKSISFLSAISLLGFSILTAMVPIPAKLGSHEGIQAFAFDALGLGAGTGTVFAMISRGAEIIVTLVGIVFLLQLGKGILRRILFNRPPA